MCTARYAKFKARSVAQTREGLPDAATARWLWAVVRHSPSPSMRTTHTLGPGRSVAFEKALELACPRLSSLQSLAVGWLVRRCRGGRHAKACSNE